MVLHSLVHNSRPWARYGQDPFTVVQRALERSFGDGWNTSFAKEAAMVVRVDVKEDEKGFYVQADLPGLTEKEVDVTFDGGLLTIRGEKKIERDESNGTWHVVERRYGSFERQVSLPTLIDESKIEAAFEKGVLTITLPKQPAEQLAAKKINIKTL